MKLLQYRVITNQAILAMSRSRADIAADLDQPTRKLCQHLMKLYLYPDTEYINGWRKEVYGFLHSVDALKGKNRYPSQQFILANTYDQNESRLSTWLRIVISNNDKITPIRFNQTDLFNRIHDYYIWLAAVLSRDGEVSRRDVYDELTSLGF